jgi:hypothetical protein
VVRALAQAMREQAAAIHGEAADLLAAAEAVPWAGLAADAMRRVARDHAAALTASAQAHQNAAAALERHAREVDQVKSLIAAAEQQVHAALSAVTAGASGLGGRVGHWLAHADLPPPGHLGWLDVRVPGWLP